MIHSKGKGNRGVSTKEFIAGSFLIIKRKKEAMAHLQQQLKRLEAERDRLHEMLESSKEKIPSSKACESLVEFVNKNAKDDPLLPGSEIQNPWVNAKKPAPGQEGKEGKGGCSEACLIA